MRKSKSLLKLWKDVENEEEVGGPAKDDINVVETSDHDIYSEQFEDE